MFLYRHRTDGTRLEISYPFLVEIFNFKFPKKGSLADLLKTPNFVLTDSQFRTVSFSVAKAMVYLHSHKPEILHRDLKAGNVLISGDLHSPNQLQVKVADFGLSCTLEFLTSSNQLSVGDIISRAPEIIKNPFAYSVKSDVFRFIFPHFNI